MTHSGRGGPQKWRFGGRPKRVIFGGFSRRREKPAKIGVRLGLKIFAPRAKKRVGPKVRGTLTFGPGPKNPQKRGFLGVFPEGRILIIGSLVSVEVKKVL